MRPHYSHLYNGSVVKHFETIDAALQSLYANPSQEKLLFIHEGVYYPEPINIFSDVQIIGAGMSFYRYISIAVMSGV